MEGKSKEEELYVYMWLIHFTVQLKQTLHCKATTLKKKKEIGLAKYLFGFFHNSLQKNPNKLLGQFYN